MPGAHHRESLCRINFFLFLFYYNFLETSDQHTAADLVNFVYSRPASSDQTDLIRDSNKMSKGN